ncbi:Protein kinase-like domain containing protein [Naviculisporaceae sp. PSN 640]
MTSADFSAEEGEIPEAIPLPRFKQEALVDRVERTRSSRPNDYEHSNDVRVNRRSRSPRGFKRPMDDRDRHDEKRFRSSSEYSGRENRRWTAHDEPQSAYKRSHRPSYQDLDRPQPRSARENERPAYRRNGNGDTRHGNSRHYDERRNRPYDRDMYSDDSRSRYRSRSPVRRDDRGRRDPDRSGPSASDYLNAQIGASSESYSSSSNVTARGYAPDSSNQTAKSDRNGRVEEGINTLSIAQASDQEISPAQPEPDVDWDPDQKQDNDAEEAEILRRRRARDAVYRRALEASNKASTTPESTQVNTPAPPKSEVETPRSTDEMSEVGLDLMDEGGLAKKVAEVAPLGAGPSAADYDPTADMQEDERRDEMRYGHVGLHGEPRNGVPIEDTEGAEKDHVTPKKAEDDEDDFNLFLVDEVNEEVLDKFNAATAKLQEAAQAQTGHGPLNGVGGGNIEGADKQGYYKMRPGDSLGPHYRIVNELGRGMFSNVARAKNLETKKIVAVKVMRLNAALRKGGFTEIAILKKLNDADPEDKKHIIRFEGHFSHKGHLCMVFENLDLNLREVVKKYGNNTGINLQSVQKYAHQIFVALGHMRKHDIIHADLKPDNILASSHDHFQHVEKTISPFANRAKQVDESRTVLKICDLGTAIDRSDALTSASEVTPYLVSRFYRAPEVILGIPYTTAIDMWSIGCTLYELYTGKILFTGATNNQMLKTIQEIRGPLVKIAKKGSRYHEFFIGDQFLSEEPSGKKLIPTFPQTNRLRELIIESAKDTGEDRHTDLANFIDLINQCLALNQDKRITPEEALRHKFFVKPTTKTYLPTKHASSKHSGASN